MYKFILPILAVLFSAPALFAQCIQYNCPTQPVAICDIVDNNPQFWNETYWLDPINNTHDLAETSADLQFRVTDTCGGATLAYMLFLDLDNNGTLETRISSDSVQQPGTVPFGNITMPGGTLRVFDKHTTALDLKYRFTLQQTVAGDTLTGKVRWNTQQSPDVYTNALLPLGTHRVIWYIRYGTSVDTCSRDITVRDCKKPVIVCKSGLSATVPPNCILQMWSSDFLQYAQDNVTPSGLLPIGIVRSGLSTGMFPVMPNGEPQTSVIFTGGNDLGTQPVQLWTKDKAGNTAFCETTVIVQDNNGHCGYSYPPNNLVACAYTESGTVIKNVYFDLQSNMPGIPPVLLIGPPSDSCLEIQQSIPIASTVSITPTKDDNHINGVSTFDLVVISKHILGIAPLTSPYKMIAADANKSNSITTFDIAELRKLVLGIYSELPHNTSWRFVSKKFVFPNPSNPWQTTFPETIQFGMIQSSMDAEFVGIKIGDLNGNALPSLQADVRVEARSRATLTLPDLSLKTGETMEIPLQMSEAAQWVSLQAGLEFDPQILDLETVTSNALPDFDENSWAKPQPGRLNISWFSVAPQTLLPAENLITLRIHARRDVRLRNALALNNESLRAEAYSDRGIAQNLSLQFREQPATATTTTIFPAQPNPTTAGTMIPLRLQLPENVLLEVFDVSGKLIFQQAKQLDAGAQMLEIQTAVLKTTGVYTWRVQAGAVVQTGRIVRQ